MTLGKKHLWTKVSLVKALVNWGPMIELGFRPNTMYVSGRVLAERALRLFPPAHLIMSGEFLPADRRHLAIPLAIPGLKTGRVLYRSLGPRPTTSIRGCGTR
jgi:hypothetical protein